MSPTRHLFVTALLLAAAGSGSAQSTQALAGSNHPPAILERSFAQWSAACARLPSNRVLKGRRPRNELLPIPQFREFEEVVSSFFALSKTGPLAQTNRWVGVTPNPNTFFNTGKAYFMASEGTPASPAIPFEPFAEKRVVPEGSEVFFHADLHGDIRSLLAELAWLNEHGYLRDFSVARTNFYIVFLGDYTDRGAYGVEVLYTLLRLKLANPGNVFLLRGNHEEVSLQKDYGFLDEGRAKYGRDFDARRVLRAYDFLPVMLYLGTGENFIQCNHGGMEPGFNGQPLLGGSGSICFQFLGTLNQRRFFTEHPEWLANADAASPELATRALRDFRPADPISPSPLGFMWNDFAITADEPQFAIIPGRAFVYGQRATEFLLRSAGAGTQQVQAVFRGHQQSSVLNPMMSRLLASRGVFRHWQKGDSAALFKASSGELAGVLEHGDERAVPQGSVWTFNVSPDSVYGEGCGYNFDAFGILRTARNFADWRLQVVNIPVN